MCCTYHSFQYTTDNYKYELSPSQPTTPQGFIKTIQHPYEIGPVKPIIKISTMMPVVANEHASCHMCSGITKSSDINFNCCCRWPIQVSKVFSLPHLSISHPTLTTLISDFISHSYSFPSHFFSSLGLLSWGLHLW